MTQRNDGNYDLSGSELEQIARITGPIIQQGFQRSLNQQTVDIGELIEKHEISDNNQFSALGGRVVNLEKIVWRVGGMVSVVAVLIPIIIEVIRHYWK